MHPTFDLTLTCAVFCCVLVSCSDSSSQTKRPRAAAVPSETSAQRDARMQWWRDARFGMFIHWGLYAIPAGEWNGKKVEGIGEWIMENAPVPVAEYEKLAPQFNPVKFDARQWARIARGAGMKYVVITSKHHDGFALFDSKANNYDVGDASPFKRDILKELADAVRAEGMTMCWYHSIMDWHNPDAQGSKFPKYNDKDPANANPNFHRYVDTQLKPQVRELLTNYGPIGVMWFDGEWIPEWTDEQGKDLYAMCRAIQPDVIVNNRVGKGRKGMQGMSRDGSFAGDFGTPEQEVPATGFPSGVDWESCITMNKSWGFKKHDHEWKSEQQLIRMLVDIASKGGNFLLNVGPTALGEIPPESVERLAAIGRWMDVNREAIYGTSASPFAKLPFGRATQKDGTLYLHVFDWPADGKLIVPMRGRVKRATLLADASRGVKAQAGEAGLQLTLSGAAPDATASVIALEIDGAVDPIAPATTAP